MKRTPKTAHDIATTAARHFGSSAQCSVTMRRDGNYLPAVSSGRRAAICDAVEVELALGPSVTAIATLRGVLVADIANCARWPEWCQTALGAGFRSAAALPAIVDRQTVIAVTFYCEGPHTWGADDVAEATLIAGQIARAMAPAARGVDQV